MKTLLALAATAVIALALACPGETTCNYPAATPPTGNPNQDVVGCWQGLGAATLVQDPYNLVVYQFFPLAEGQTLPDWREIQSPNSIYPGGNVYHNVWQVMDAGTVEILDIGSDFPQAAFQITDTSLVLNFLIPPSSVLTQPLRRATCTGFGFDSKDVACPASP